MLIKFVPTTEGSDGAAQSLPSCRETMQVHDRYAGAWVRHEVLLDNAVEDSYITSALALDLGLTPLPLPQTRLSLHSTQLGTVIPTHEVTVEVRPLTSFLSGTAASDFLCTMLVVDQLDDIGVGMIIGQKAIKDHLTNDCNPGEEPEEDPVEEEADIGAAFTPGISLTIDMEGHQPSQTANQAPGEWVAQTSLVSVHSPLAKSQIYSMRVVEATIQEENPAS